LSGNGQEPVSLQDIKSYLALVKRYPDNVSSKIITRLLDELQSYRTELIRLRAAMVDKRGPLTDDSLCPFGQYKDERLGDVPDEYLRWWFRENSDRSILELEVHCLGYPKKAIAIQKLKLHDYLKFRWHQNTKS